MQTVRLDGLNDFEEWRAAARGLLLGAVPPDEVVWADPLAPRDLFAEPDSVAQVVRRKVGIVPPRFIDLAEHAICSNDPERFALLYRLLWRLQKDRELILLRDDPDVARLYRRVGAVRQEIHKIHAFIRFKAIKDDTGLERYAAWFEPEHYTLEPAVPFFTNRFSNMIWAIVTPYRSAFWNGESLEFGSGGSKADVPAEDALETAWKSYFSSIFNPARLNVRMMKSEMPVRYWRNLPEAELIPSLVRGARQAEEAMMERQATNPPVRHVRQMERAPVEAPAIAESYTSLAEARAAAEGCHRCPLYQFATQTVFGEGPENAEIMMVGEQPGDNEDLTGKPFVGPAGKVLDEAIAGAGIDRTRVYVTNAVKHFKFVPRGKKRIHQKPNAGEIKACRFWLDLERQFVRPKAIVALGASAVSGLLGGSHTLKELRDAPIELEVGTMLFVTVHPSYLLRMPDRQQAAIERDRFEADLKRVREWMERRAH